MTTKALPTPGDVAQANTWGTLLNDYIESMNLAPYSVLIYGADNTGATDCSAEFEAARDAAGAGGTVFVPAGTYLFSSAIDPGDYISWIGVGLDSILKCAAGNTDNAIFKTSGSSIGYDIFENLAFRSANSSCIAIDLDRNYYMNRCTFRNCHFYAEMTGNIRGLFGQNTFYDCTFGAFGTAGATYWYIVDDNVSVSYTSLANTYINCYFTKAAGTGVKAITFGYGNTQKFLSCTFETMTAPLLSATGVSDVVFENCCFEDIEPGGTYNAVCEALYDSESGAGTRMHFLKCRLTNGGTTPWKSIVYCDNAGCSAGFEACMGGMSQSFFTEDSSNKFDLGQAGAGGLAHCVRNGLTQYAGTLEYDYRRFSTPMRARNGIESHGAIEIFSDSSLGSESLTNGALTSGTSWSATTDCTLAANAATWAYSAGTASTLTQASGTLAVAGVANAWYKLTYTVTGALLSATYGYGRMQITTSFAASAEYIPAINGSHVHYFKAAASPGDFVLTATLSTGQGFTVDDLSLKQCTDGDLWVSDDLTVKGDATVAGTATVGKSVLGSSTVSAAGPTDNVSVSGVSVVFLNTTSNNVTIGGFAGGVSGQVLHVVKNVTANNATLENVEGGGSQDIYLLTGGDETLTGVRGGWTLICDGTSWMAATT